MDTTAYVVFNTDTAAWDVVQFEPTKTKTSFNNKSKALEYAYNLSHQA